MEDLRKRASVLEPVEDLHDAHEKMGWGDMYRHVPTWRLMSKLIMAIQGTPGWEEPSSAREYQATKLGRAGGDTFVTELMPLPCPSVAAWPYSSIFPTRGEYIEAVRPGRIQWLRSEVKAFHPRFVICYGKGNWRYYKEIFDGVAFKHKLNEQIRVGHREHSIILLIPFLSYYFVTTALITRIAYLFRREHN